MSQEEIIEIGGVEVVLHFRFSTLYKLGRKWGLNSVNDVLSKIVNVSIECSDDIPLDAMDVYADVFGTCSKQTMDKEKVIDYLFKNPSVIVRMTELLIASIQGDTSTQQDSKEQDEENLGK